MSLRQLAMLSGVYDLVLAVPMLVAAPATARLFGARAPVPLVNAQINGVFTLTLAFGGGSQAGRGRQAFSTRCIPPSSAARRS